jgi:hypothetical protein
LACRLFLGESFPELQKRLWLELESACGSDPLAPKWLVVSNSTLANHMRLELARRARETTLAGIRVIALPRFLARLADQLGLAGGYRWHAGLDLLLCQLTAEIPNSSSLRRLRDLRNGFTLLRPVLLDLADSGLGVSQLETLADLADDGELRPTEKDLIAFYITWLLALGRLEVNWQPLAEQKIPEALLQHGETGVAKLLGTAGTSPRLFFHGFYDFTDNAAQILASLARVANLGLFFPYSSRGPGEPHSAFAFARPGLEDLKARMGPLLTEETVSRPDKTSAEAFFLSSFPSGAISEQPGFLTFGRASGLRAEVLSAAVRIRRWIDDGLDPGSILLLAPDAGPYLDFVEETFADFCIPLRLEGVVDSGRPAIDPIRLLGILWKDKAPVEWILAYFRDFPDLPLLSGVDLDAFETRLRSLAGSGGESWSLLLQAVESAAPSLSGKRPLFQDAETDLIRAIVRTWIRPGEQSLDHLSQAEARRFLGLLQRDWLSDGTTLDELIQGLDFTSPKTPIPVTVLQDWMINRATPNERSLRLTGPAVTFVPMMRARGITARAAVVLGLAAGRFPFRVQEDPFLSDRSRIALSRRFGDLGHRLPVKSNITDEMRLLFLLLNSCVELVHWVIPETDETGRTVAPTPWVQRYLRHWEGRGPSSQSWPRMPRGPAEQARLLHRLEPHRASLLPPSLAVYIDPGVLSCFQNDAIGAHLICAYNKRSFDPAWNGLVPEAAFTPADPPRKSLRVTDLENLARCPFRFYARTLLGAASLSDLEADSGLDSLTWGSLLHALLQEAVAPTLDRRPSLSEIADSFDEKALQELILRLPSDLSLRLKLMPPLFAREARRRLLGLVRSYLDSVRDQAGVRPMALETRHTHPFPGFDNLEVSGQADRIDKTEDGRACIIDYKSGKKPRELPVELRLGYRLQPLLYPWLYSQATGESEIDFAYVFMSEDPPLTERVQPGLSSDEFFTGYLEILSQGAYLCFSKEAAQSLDLEDLDPCRYCDYISLCRRFESTAPNRARHFFERLLAGRLGLLQEILAKGGRV